MLARNPDHHFMFALADLQRAVRAYADQKAARHGITRAQWAVLAKLHKEEGLQQAKLAKLLDIQPITLTRLVDRLCAGGLVERRADAKDRRANRLYLTPAARPLMLKLRALRDEINQTALAHLKPAEADQLVAQLELIKENVRAAYRAECEPRKSKERRNG
jgi:MarR family transcriptional regulator, transcriptional regulator for hemolysin